MGISAYYFISRLAVPFILIPFYLAFSDFPPHVAALLIVVMMMFLYCLSALAGGAVAGFWVRNWLPQGLGVACGVLFIPLLWMLVLTPENWPRFCITLALTSAFTVVGAFLGHLVVKPNRITRS